MGHDERMERLLEEEEGVVWPDPRDDLPEEPSEPWARSGQPEDRPWSGWGDDA